MQYIKNGKCFKVARITGPSHNILGIVFHDSPGDSELVVLQLSGKKPCTPCLLPNDVKEKVLDGVATANRDFGTTYTVQRIEFVEDDSPPADIYAYLARSIIERLVNGQAFTEAP